MFSHSPAKHAACSNQTMTVRNRFTGYRILVIHLGVDTRIAKLVMHRPRYRLPVFFYEFRQTEPIGIILVMCWSDTDLRL